eukprot:m.239844 g.239844  ORF g.239844 m.239844 type:complete len:735 (+) comp33752_c0_seq4:431-2635(+)
MQPIGRTVKTGVAELLKASISGDYTTARRIVRKRAAAALNIHGSDGCTPLLLACKHGHLDLVKLFLTNGALIGDRDHDPKRQGNALHYAAWGGHAKIVVHLVNEGASLDDVDIVGNTALLYAVYGGHRDVVSELISRGRSLQERNSKNHTALLQAACGGHLHLVEWLLTQGFSLDEADHDGNTSLLFAAWGGHLDLIHFLLENGSSLHEQNHNGHSIFLSAANGGRVEIVEWLLGQGFSLTETNNNGDTALLLAAYGGHQPLVERLLQLGASLEERNGCGFTPLLSAANGGQLEMAKWLLQNGSSLTECDNDGYTSLILAACGGNVELVQFLLSQGSSLADRNNNGDSALLLAAYCSHRELVDWLLKNGSSLAEKNKTGMGVLISASNGGNCEVVELLLQHVAQQGADCGDSLEHIDEGGYTPLLLAAQRGHIDVVRLLASYGANVKARTTRHDNDAIALAVDFPEVQQYLTLVWDWRPLQIAADNRMVDRVHALIQAGASLECSSNTPSMLTLATQTSAYTAAKSPVAELETLVRQATMPWAPCRHSLFSQPHRQTIWQMMKLQAMFQQQDTHPQLPSEIWLHIATFVQRSWFVTDATALEIGWVEPTALVTKRPTTTTSRVGQSQSRNVQQNTSESARAVLVLQEDEYFGLEFGDDSDDDEMNDPTGRRARNSTSTSSAAARCLSPLPSKVYQDEDDVSSTSSSLWSKDCEVNSTSDSEESKLTAALRVAWV